MSTDPAPPRSPPVGAVMVLVLAGLLYAGMIACLNDYQSGGEDAFGRGLSSAFAILFGLALWGLLGILLLIGRVKGEMPGWAAIAVAILLPLSAIAAAIAMDLGASDVWWLAWAPILVPILLPPPIAAYAIWARLPQLHRALPPNPTSAVLLGLVVLLTLAPMPQYTVNWLRQVAEARREEAASLAEQEAEEERRRQNRERFDKLTADSPLWEWAVFFGKNSEFDQEAIAGALKLTHRQADAEEALRRGMGFPLVEYRRLDLAATPAFCVAANDFLRQDAAAHRAPDNDTEYTPDAQPYTEPDDVAVVEWLTQHCDIDDAIAQIRDTVGGYKPSSSRDAYLAVVAWRRGNGFWERDDAARALREYDEALRLRPDNDQFHKSRGDIYFNMARYDDALADYDEAIRLNPGYSEAYYSRGNAYDRKGEDDKAIAAFDDAIRMAPEFVAAHNNRGLVYARQGKLDLAIQDYDAALQYAPKFRLAFSNRGRVRFYLAAYADAAADFGAALQLKPDNVYDALWLYLSRLRAGQDAREALRGDAAKLDRSAWPYPIIAALLGETDETAVLVAAGSDTNPNRKGQECEANFYFGAKKAAEGDTATARHRLSAATADCPADYLERIAAKFELAKLP
ncbi:MAG TPA: tetratricopeptide repeat protein [Stellaceae bacterium]|nr:tetratricopeptide repeat protein [Stellaceae bacterium]